MRPFSLPTQHLCEHNSLPHHQQSVLLGGGGLRNDLPCVSSVIAHLYECSNLLYEGHNKCDRLKIANGSFMCVSFMTAGMGVFIVLDQQFTTSLLLQMRMCGCRVCVRVYRLSFFFKGIHIVYCSLRRQSHLSEVAHDSTFVHSCPMVTQGEYSSAWARAASSQYGDQVSSSPT
jgi:hypothetical protein